jgi:hypothetical protein
LTQPGRQQHAAFRGSSEPDQWKAQLQEGAAGVFGPASGADTPAVDVESLHAKIGELMLENDFLERRSAKWVC